MSVAAHVLARCGLVLSLAAGACCCAPAQAAEIRKAGPVVRMSGPIAPGDAARLRKILQAGPSIVGLEITSPGGLLDEGVEIAELVHRRKMTVSVDVDCESMCAVIFLAGEKRQIGPGAKIGVHAISNRGRREDSATRNETIKLARLLHRFGAPDSVVGKMVTTDPANMAYLEAPELAALGISARDGSGPALADGPREHRDPVRSSGPNKSLGLQASSDGPCHMTP